MIKLVCLDVSYEFKDCNELQTYLYSISESGDVFREFTILDEDLKCIHKKIDEKEVDYHKKDDILEYIKSYLNEAGYCNYKI